MELPLPVDPTRDPFLAAVRRRHPDVDVVGLPAEPGERTPSGPGHPGDRVRPGVVDAALDDVRRWAERCWLVLDVPPPVPSPRPRLAPGPALGALVAQARGGALRPDDPACLTRLAYELTFAGWRVRRRAGRVEVLTASLTGAAVDLLLRATYAAGTGALVVRVASAPLEVGVEHARSRVGS